MSHYESVKAMVVELGFVPHDDDPEGTLFVITDEDRGILNLVVDCQDDILRLEQVLGLITPQTGLPATLGDEPGVGAWSVRPWPARQTYHMDRHPTDCQP